MAIHLDYDVMKQKANELRRKEDFIGSELRSLQAAIQQMLDTDFKTDSASGDYGSVSRTHQGNLSGDHLLLDGVSTAA